MTTLNDIVIRKGRCEVYSITMDNNAPYLYLDSIKLKLLPRYYHSFLRCSPFGPSLTSARNQIQMAPAHLNCSLLHSVHPHFKLPLGNIHCKQKFETRMDPVQEW